MSDQPPGHPVRQGDDCRLGKVFIDTLSVGGVSGFTPKAPVASGGAAPAGGAGSEAGGYDTSAHRDALITLVNNIRTALIANGIMS